MPHRSLPLVADDGLPATMRQHVETLEAKGIDTAFHRYAAHSHLASEFYWDDFYVGLFAGGRLERRTKEIVRLVLAAISGCHFCRANDITSAREQGVSERDVEAALALDFETLPRQDAAAAEFAQRFSLFHDGSPLSAHEWAELRRHFDDEQISELLFCTAVLAGVGRMLVVAGFVPQVCDLPGSSA